MALRVSQESMAGPLSIDVSPPLQIPFFDAKRFFAVDSPCSTVGAIMRAQAKILAALYGICEDGVTKWDHKMEMPQVLDHVPVNYLARYYTPTTRCNQFVRDSDLWILIRDGEIAERNVAELTRVAGVVETIHVPVVLLLIVGGRYSSPSNTNISIGITSFAAAREALILFKDYSTGRLYLIGGKGEISPLKNEGFQDSIDLSSWEWLPE